MNRPIAIVAAGALGVGLALAVPQVSSAAPTTATRATVTSSTASDSITVTSIVRQGTQPGCLVMNVNYSQIIWNPLVVTYLLIGGDRDVLVPGAKVRVTGVVDNSIVSPCMQGHPLVVSSATPA